MGKTKQIHQIIVDLDQLINHLSNIRSDLENMCHRTEDLPMKDSSTIILKLEDVRAVLADKSRLGFTKDIKKILSEFGASKLSEIKESDYASLLKKVEWLGNE